MKRVIGIAAILLIWIGSAQAGELKVKVPVDELEQMKNRIQTLEKKNQELENEVSSLSQESSDEELKKEIEQMAREKKELQEKVDSMAETTPEEASYVKEKDQRIDALGRENRRLKRTVSNLKQAGVEMRSDRRTARQVYFEANKKFAPHIYR